MTDDRAARLQAIRERWENRNDARFVRFCMVEEDVPWLLAEVERLEGVERRLAADLRELNQYHDEDTEAIGTLRADVERLERDLSTCTELDIGLLPFEGEKRTVKMRFSK